MSASLACGQNTRMAALVLLVRVRVSGNSEIGPLSSHVESSKTAKGTAARQIRGDEHEQEVSR